MHEELFRQLRRDHQEVRDIFLALMASGGKSEQEKLGNLLQAFQQEKDEAKKSLH